MKLCYNFLCAFIYSAYVILRMSILCMSMRLERWKTFLLLFISCFFQYVFLQIEWLFCLSYVPTPRFLIPCTLYEFSSYFGFPNINRYLVIFYKLDHIYVTQIYYLFVLQIIINYTLLPRYFRLLLKCCIFQKIKKTWLFFSRPIQLITVWCMVFISYLVAKT